MSGTPVRIGQIVGAHGLKGYVKILPLTGFLQRFSVGSRLFLKGKWVTVEAYSIHKARPLVKLSGIETMDAAQAMQWEYVEAVLDAPADLEEDEYLTVDLIGCKVVTVEGRMLGTLDDVLAHPAHDVLQVGDVLIPVVKQFITRIDLPRRTITVTLIPGMLPEEEDEA